MKLFEDIELRLSDLYQKRKRLADRYESVYFINEAQIFSYDLALEHFKESVQAEYNSLCPKPTEFRYHNYQMQTVEWNYIAIDNGRNLIRLMQKPVLTDSGWANAGESEYYLTNSNKELPLGIDWRLCCWSIEDAKRIHGEEE